MKIVHITTTSPFSEIYAYQENLIAHYHRKMGHDVTVIAPTYSTAELDKEEPIGEYALKDGIKVIRLPLLVRNRLIYEHLYLVRGLYSALLSEEPDLIFAHAVGSFNYISLVRIKKKRPATRIVIDNHADYINSLHSPITRFLHKRIYRLLLVPSLIKVTDIFYGVTPSRCDFLHEVYGVPKDKIKLLLMGADDEKMKIEEKETLRDGVRSRFRIEKEDFLVVTGGKIDPLKNIHLLAKAINNSSYSKIKMLIFGTISKDLESLFDHLKSDRIQCIGWIPSEDVYKYFYAADVVIFPGLHSVLWEQAVASQVPCAFTRMKGFEHLDFGGNCILMDGNDEGYYQQIVEHLYLDRDLYSSLLKKSRSEKAFSFHYSRIAKQVLNDCEIS